MAMRSLPPTACISRVEAVGAPRRPYLPRVRMYVIDRLGTKQNYRGD